MTLGVLLPLLAILLALTQLPTAAAQTTLDGRHLQVLAQQGSGISVVFFLRSDCPVSNSYAPEVQRLMKSFSGTNVHFWLVYPDVSDATVKVRENLAQFYSGTHLLQQTLRDPEHALVHQAKVDMMPEAAVFRGRQLWYSGRIDDRVAGLGKYRAAATEHDLADAISAAMRGEPAHPADGPAYGCYIADAQ